MTGWDQRTPAPPAILSTELTWLFANGGGVSLGFDASLVRARRISITSTYDS